MVRRIMDAGRDVLAAEGYRAASTNKIAKAARISPGSLYQYFPNKDAIIEAVIVEQIEQAADRVTGHLLSNIGSCAEEELLGETLRILLDEFEHHTELLRAIVENTPQIGMSRRMAAVEERVSELLSAHQRLRSRPESPSPARIWMSVQAVEHLTVRYLLDRPPIDRDEFVDEMTALILRYAYRPSEP